MNGIDAIYAEGIGCCQFVEQQAVGTLMRWI